VNQEYHEKIREVSVLNLDVMNLLSGADIACIFLDDKLNIRKFTKAASERIPLRVMDIGRPLRDLAGGSSSFAPAFKNLDKVLLKRDVQEFELVDEAGRWFLIRCLPYEDEITSSSVLGVVLTFFDVSRLRYALDKALIEGARADAEHSAKMVFLSTMRQDIQSPLNAICGFSELLKNSGELGSESRGFASYVSKSSRLLAALLDTNLSLASMDTGKITRVIEPFSLVDEVYQVRIAFLLLKKILDKYSSFQIRSPNCCLPLLLVRAWSLWWTWTLGYCLSPNLLGMQSISVTFCSICAQVPLSLHIKDM
jgi:signal transduction histidine kinase